MGPPSAGLGCAPMSDAGNPSDHVFDAALERRLRANLAAHPIRRQPLGDRRHAAVALVVVDSDPELHGAAPSPSLPDPERVGGIPGLRPDDDIDGSVEGTAGGPAVLLTRRAARLNA